MTPVTVKTGEMSNVLITGPIAWNLVVHVDEFPAPRPHTVSATSDHEALGGTSAGKALNLARLGVEVTLATVFGDDDAGRRITAALTGVDLLVTPTARGPRRRSDPVPAEPVREVIDSNGVGDAFFAGFLAAHLRGARLTECLRQAARSGALSVRSRELAADDLTDALVRADGPLS